MIRLDDDTEFEMIETPDIPGPQLIADIGGMAGFMLGQGAVIMIIVKKKCSSPMKPQILTPR